jgi:dTDP-4-dehydrorhamnose reductase
MSCRCLVFGASGFLGSRLVPYLRNSGFDTFSIARSGKPDFQVGEICTSVVKEVIELYKPDCVLNLIAATNVDKCESDVPYAVNGNMTVISAIADALSAYDKRDIHLIHLSTDQVYDGTGNHTEEVVCPVNVYGLTKLAGEFLIKHPSTTILRTNFVGKSSAGDRKSFTDWLVDSLLSNQSITLYSDIQFNPVHISTLCAMLARLMDLKLYGIFNFAASSGISKAEFALRLAFLLNLQTKSIQLGSVADKPLIAKRPLDMTISPNKLLAKIGVVAPNINEEIIKTANDYKNEKC